MVWKKSSIARVAGKRPSQSKVATKFVKCVTGKTTRGSTNIPTTTWERTESASMTTETTGKQRGNPNPFVLPLRIDPAAL